ncbi:hypothetical protein [Bradyrhizobium sp. 2TAF24]|uniref:hypothetical protein n=1 Tax=Bradyrhizobium sp. 2TAF24 TaxID=3233011 RepID=UPI003F935424
MVTRIVKLAEDDGRMQVAVASDRTQLQLLSKRIECVGLGDEADAKAEFRISELEDVKFFDGLIDVIFRRSTASDIETTDDCVLVQLTSRDAQKKYVALINALVFTGRGHQYLDPENIGAAVELLVSLDEFPE